MTRMTSKIFLFVNQHSVRWIQKKKKGSKSKVYIFKIKLESLYSAFTPTIMVIIFSDLLMFDQVYLSPKVKRIVIIIRKTRYIRVVSVKNQ